MTLASCKTDPAPGEETNPPSSDSSEGTNNGDPSDNPSDDDNKNNVEFPIEMLAQMKIVYPEHAATEVAEAADSLKGAIKTAFGCELTVSSDYIREGSSIFCELEYEILIGETNREDDDFYYTEMRYEDFGYRISESGKKILIGGKNDDATLQAISDFAYNICLLKKGGDGMFFNTGLALYQAGTYTVDTLTLNGTSIRDYTVVYPANGTAFEKQLARRLVSKISYLTGYQLEYVSDEQTYADGYEILIGKTNRTGAAALTAATPENMDGCMAGAGKFVALYGSGAQGNSTAVAALIADMEGNIPADRKVALTVGESKTVQPSEKISMMTFNVLVGSVSVARDERVYEMILRYLPDVVG
ncbi:MAG: hypothetical protein NC131_20205, partial [Roseburia sp.]|nr:hypothetical protein [Roseburia sp.]